jgi:uncharacterized protein
MAKPGGAICNLDCAYCFYLAKELLYPGSRFEMAHDLHETYVRQLLESHGVGEVVMAWQGGEPTILGLDFFRRTIELQRKYARPGQRVLNTLQTNGTLIDDAWARFLREHRFLVGISIDGPEELHDRFRVDKGGKPTFARALRGLEKLQEHGVEWNVLTCVHAGNGDAGVRVYRFLRDDLRARHLQFIPVVERAARAGSTGAVGESSVGPEQYGRFLVEVFDEWVAADVGRVFVQLFDTTFARWLGLPGGLCVHEETCGRQVALEHTGDLYACDHFVEPRFRLGNIRQSHLLALVDSPQQRRFGLAKRETLTAQCRSCDVRPLCNGGCPKDRFALSSDGEPGHNYLCEGYGLFFRHVRPALRDLAELAAS